MTSYRAATIANQPIMIRVSRFGIGHNVDCRDAAALIQGGNPCGTALYWSHMAWARV